MIAQPLDPCGDACSLATRWGISLQLAVKLLRVRGRVPFAVSIISGFRTAGRQQEVGNLPPCSSGKRPCSTHTVSPATGADLWPGIAVDDDVKLALGSAAVLEGLRWGGGSPVDSRGIPSDWNHFDLGPIP